MERGRDIDKGRGIWREGEGYREQNKDMDSGR